MSGHPAHNAPKDRGAEAIWRAILRVAKPGGLFRRIDIQAEIGASRDTLFNWLARLEKGGYIRRLGALPDKSVVYRLPKTFSDETPRLRKDGTPTQPRQAPENGNARLWRAMKMLKRFTARELALAASIEDRPVRHQTAAAYLVNLGRAGYLRREDNAGWRLIKDTGPLAPMIQRGKHVYDQNTGERHEYPSAQ